MVFPYFKKILESGGQFLIAKLVLKNGMSVKIRQIPLRAASCVEIRLNVSSDAVSMLLTICASTSGGRRFGEGIRA